MSGASLLFAGGLGVAAAVGLRVLAQEERAHIAVLNTTQSASTVDFKPGSVVYCEFEGVTRADPTGAGLVTAPYSLQKAVRVRNDTYDISRLYHREHAVQTSSKIGDDLKVHTAQHVQHSEWKKEIVKTKLMTKDTGGNVFIQLPEGVSGSSATIKLNAKESDGLLRRTSSHFVEPAAFKANANHKATHLAHDYTDKDYIAPELISIEEVESTIPEGQKVFAVGLVKANAISAGNNQALELVLERPHDGRLFICANGSREDVIREEETRYRKISQISNLFLLFGGVVLCAGGYKIHRDKQATK